MQMIKNPISLNFADFQALKKFYLFIIHYVFI